MITITEVKNEKQIIELAAIADSIWHEYFTFILSENQINYMVKKFLSVQAIKRQKAEEKYMYYIVKENNKICGFFAVKPEKEKLFLSKLYLEKEKRGKGYASIMLKHIEVIAEQLKLKSIYLTVNKNNLSSINVYKKKGFKVIKEEQFDIGNNYIMDDYVMEKTL